MLTSSDVTAYDQSSLRSVQDRHRDRRVVRPQALVVQPVNQGPFFGSSLLSLLELYCKRNMCGHPSWAWKSYNYIASQYIYIYSCASQWVLLVTPFQVYDGFRSTSGKGKSEPATSKRKLVQTLTGWKYYRLWNETRSLHVLALRCCIGQDDWSLFRVSKGPAANSRPQGG